MLKRLATALLLRRLSLDLARIADTLDRQTTLLARLTDRFAPLLPVDSPVERATIRGDTGVSHLDVDDASLALAYMDRTYAHTGHIPDEDEILIHLADEKTQNLAERLTARDEELSRLMEARR